MLAYPQLLHAEWKSFRRSSTVHGVPAGHPVGKIDMNPLLSNRLLELIAVCLAMVAMCRPVSATSVRSVDIDEMLQNSELVFQGRCLDAESRSSGPRGLIYTYLTFEVLDVIKGTDPGNDLKLGFAGGSIGQNNVKVMGMRYPRPGEDGIYFVESLSKNQVHPLYGWSQGHFLVVEDKAGIERVLTYNRRPVTAVESTVKKRSTALSNGIAAGVQTQSVDTMDAAITVDQFKRSLRESLKDD